jgi:hypothetical protein
MSTHSAVMLFLLLPNACAANGGYEFVPDTDRFVMLRHGDACSIGKLDGKGNFLPDPRYVNLRGAYLSAIPPCTLINSRGDSVYEFRSGRLIRGKIDKDGSFVPDLGTKVIRFEDYKPEKDLRIYNLPGKFVPKKKADEEK